LTMRCGCSVFFLGECPLWLVSNIRMVNKRLCFVPAENRCFERADGIRWLTLSGTYNQFKGRGEVASRPNDEVVF
jgi:hypothetical protein